MENNEPKPESVIKKHIDTIIILGAFASCMLWMNGKFNEVDMRFAKIDQELAVLKTVMIMQKIMPADMAAKQ
jgi:hypothetical protein